MGLFDKIKNNDVQLEETKDTLGGGGLPETGIYSNAVIKMAYIDYSKGGAMSVNFHFELEGGRKLRSQQWITSGDAKGNKNYYTDRNGKNQPLPGYTMANDIALLTLETAIEDCDHEEKVISLYDFTQGKEVPQPKDVLVDLINQKVTLAVEKQVVDKTADDGTGKYVPTGETREQNEVVKAFHNEYGVTVAEARAGIKEPDFLNRWKAKNEGQVINKAKGASAGAPKAGAPAAAPAPKATKSLFA